MRTVVIKNNTQEEKIWIKSFVAEEEFTLPTDNIGLLENYASYGPLLTAIGNSEASVGNGTIFFTSINDQLNWLRGDIPINAYIETTPPFASKSININGVSKKLYKRMTGIQSALVIGDNELFFTIPFAWCKVLGITVIGGSLLDNADLYVLDTEDGGYYGIPNQVLNQYGSNVNIAKDYFKCECNYDADVYQGMQLKIVYTSVSEKTIGINFDLHEVKS